MKLCKEEWSYWLNLGVRLGDLEFVWGSQFEEAQSVFQTRKKEILMMIDNDVIVNEGGYRQFFESICCHYLRKNPECSSLILIGVCIYRSSLYKRVHDEYKRKELFALAKSALDSIPASIVPDREKLLSVIMNNKGEDVTDLLEDVYACVENIGETDTKPTVDTFEKYLFISYSSNDLLVTSQIKARIEESGIKCWMAPKSVPDGVTII